MAALYPEFVPASVSRLESPPSRWQEQDHSQNVLCFHFQQCLAIVPNSGTIRFVWEPQGVEKRQDIVQILGCWDHRMS